MVSKSRTQRQKHKRKQAEGNTEPAQISTKKSVHLKKTRPNMKGKMKIRMGHESADIYDNFEDSKQINWTCPTCNRVGRVFGFCVQCEAAKIGGQQQQQQAKQQQTAASTKKATPSSAKAATAAAASSVLKSSSTAASATGARSTKVAKKS